MGISYLIPLNNPLFKNMPFVGSFRHLVMRCICVFVYLYLCIFVWDTWEYQFRYPWTKSFQKMYGLYGLKHHKVERLKRWRTDRQTNKQTDRISSYRLDPSGRRGRVKIRNPKFKKSRNPEIQNAFFFENPQSPRKSGRFDIRKSPVALFVAKI